MTPSAEAEIADAWNTVSGLLAREFEILRLLVAGFGSDDIGKMLNISPKTVGNSHYLIKRKLGAASDIELTRLAIKLDVLDPRELAGRIIFERP